MSSLTRVSDVLESRVAYRIYRLTKQLWCTYVMSDEVEMGKLKAI